MEKLIGLFLLFAVTAMAQKGNVKSTATEQAALPVWQQFNGNRINAAISSNGPYADYYKAQSRGLEWPKGSNKTAVATAGLWIIGKHIPSDSLRTAIMDYTSEYQAGPILTTFNTAINDSSVAADPSDPKYRVYKINKGDNASTNADYAAWPGDLGAPYNDLNKNGMWDPGIDTPKLTGDQTLWCVYNDAHPMNHRNSGVTNPMGLEVHATYFGYDGVELLQDIMFIRWKIINKSDASYDSTYVGLYADIDMGDANDDLVGSDPFFHLNYTYNGDNDDGGFTGYGSKPPACGFVILQGPAVPGEAGDSALRNDRYIKGYRNLLSTSSLAILKSLFPYTDPPLGNVSFAHHAYNFLQGKTSIGTPLIDPHTNNTTTYMFSGDPVTGIGWMQTDMISPRDNRSLISTGPFMLAPGDTQEIVAAFVIAQGKDRLTSITELRRATDAAFMLKRANFPLKPSTTITEVSESDSTNSICFSADVHGQNAEYLRINIYSPDTLGYLSKILMFDDGSGVDLAASDGIFSTTFTVPRSPYPHSIDLTVFERGGGSRWNKISRFHTSRINVTHPVIYSDNLNNDGIVNTGETVRFGFSLQNHTSYTHTNISVTRADAAEKDTAKLQSIDPFSTISTMYSENDPSTYLTFTIPLEYSQTLYAVPLVVADSYGNVWRDTLKFPVTKIQSHPPVVTKIRGKSNAQFDIIVTNSSALKNHEYVIYGIDSVGRPSLTTYGILDSTSGTVLAEKVPVSILMQQSPSLPEYDGFKIIINNVDTRFEVENEFPVPTEQWFTSSIVVDSIGTISTLHYAEIPEIHFRFSVPLSYTDLNANGTYDSGEPYVTDSLNETGTQRGYFYRQESGLPSSMHYVGYNPVPFAVYAVDGETEQKLTVVINDRDKNSQWDANQNTNPARNTITVLNSPYDPTGSQYDSSKGGTDLSHLFAINARLPLYYRVDLYTKPGVVLFKNPVTWNIRSSHPFSSRDRYLFNPTVLSNIEGNHVRPVSFSIEQNFPNPFNPSTTIQFSLPERSHVNLSVFNTLGQRVATLIDDVKNEGKYEIRWNGISEQSFSVASGVYIYQIKVGNGTASRKMLLIK